MPTPDILSFETLLAPVSDDAPAGVNPRRSSALSAKFDKLKESFSAAIALEKQEAMGDSPSTPPAKSWGPLVGPASDLLARDGKDLEVANWLVQALVRVHGLIGLRDGSRLFHELVERYWDGLHPSPAADGDGDGDDEDDEDERLLYVEKLQVQGVLAALRLAPITAAKGGGPFSYDAYARANRAAMAPGNEDAAAAGRQQKEKILAAARESGADFYRTLLEDIGLTQTHLDGLESLLMEKTGSSSMVLGKLRDTFGEIASAIRDISRDVIPPEVVAEAAGDGGGAGAAPGGAAGDGGGPAVAGFRVSGGNAAQNREAALRTLSDIAAFFKATEPHSTIGYTLETLVTRARMPLPKLLEDLIPDEATRTAILTTAGIRLPPPPES